MDIKSLFAKAATLEIVFSDRLDDMSCVVRIVQIGRGDNPYMSLVTIDKPSDQFQNDLWERIGLRLRSGDVIILHENFQVPDTARLTSASKIDLEATIARYGATEDRNVLVIGPDGLMQAVNDL